MARIVRVHALGGPEVLRLGEEPDPMPGTGEARIRVGAIGLNRVEAMYRSGDFGEPPLPARIGYEAAGTIDLVGDGVTGFTAGDRVAVLPGIMMEAHGTYGDTITVPADMLVTLPDDLPFREAAATWMAYLTAYAIVDTGHVREGQTVVVTAASSSVGIAAIQIANAAGARPIAVTRGRDKAAALQGLGAADVVITDERPLANAVRELTGGRGADLAFDAVAGDTLAALTGVMVPGGTIIVYGSLGGDRAAFDLHPLMLGGVGVRGFATHHVMADPVRRAAAIDYVRDGLASGALRPVIDRSFPLDRIADAHRHLESNAQLGKIIVEV